MMRRTVKRAATLAALAVAGCGGSGMNAADLAEELENGDWSGATVSNVTCIEKDARLFTCMGDYTATRESVEANMGIDTSAFTDEDWDVLINGQSTRTSWEVTVDGEGAWIAEPR